MTIFIDRKTLSMISYYKMCLHSRGLFRIVVTSRNLVTVQQQILKGNNISTFHFCVMQLFKRLQTDHTIVILFSDKGQVSPESLKYPSQKLRVRNSITPYSATILLLLFLEYTLQFVYWVCIVCKMQVCMESQDDFLRQSSHIA